MGNYDEVARREKDRQEKGKGRADFQPVVYGEEKRCPTCWTLLTERENTTGQVSKYCFNCMNSMASIR